MAALMRSPKSGSHQGTNELMAFNIDMVDINIETFFGNAQLPDITLSHVILDNVEFDDAAADQLTKPELDFFQYMGVGMSIPPGEESTVDDFAAFLLKRMRYDEGRWIIETRKAMRFEMCGERVDAKVDVCVVDLSGHSMRHILLVQEIKVRMQVV